MNKEEIKNFILRFMRFSDFCEEKFFEYAEINNIKDPDGYNITNIDFDRIIFEKVEYLENDSTIHYKQIIPMDFLYQ